MTVSRALRNHPEVSVATRERIQSLAMDLGYRPNPMVSVLMSQVAHSRKPTFLPTLIYVWSHSVIKSKKDLHLSRGSYFKGANERAQEHGFQLDAMRLNDDGMSQQRFSDILRARGTPGIIIAPQESAEGYYELDWAAFAAVAIGYSIRSPRLHRVCLNYHSGIIHALHQLYEKGFRRFGLVLGRKTDQRILHLWSSGFLTFHWDRKMPGEPKIMVSEHFTKQCYGEWFRKSRPEVVFCYEKNQLIQWTREIEAERESKTPRCRFIHLDQDFVEHPELFIGSMQSCRRQMGAAAIDLLVGRIKHNETGVPETPKTVVIDPQVVWHEGSEAFGARS